MNVHRAAEVVNLTSANVHWHKPSPLIGFHLSCASCDSDRRCNLNHLHCCFFAGRTCILAFFSVDRFSLHFPRLRPTRPVSRRLDRQALAPLDCLSHSKPAFKFLTRFPCHPSRCNFLPRDWPPDCIETPRAARLPARFGYHLGNNLMNDLSQVTHYDCHSTASSGLLRLARATVKTSI
jgi:hypothetical protein